MSKIIDILAKEFTCAKCGNHGASVERLSMSGTGITRFLDLQPYRFAFASCHNCGYTEVYNLKVLEGKDDVGTLIDILFAG